MSLADPMVITCNMVGAVTPALELSLERNGPGTITRSTYNVPDIASANSVESADADSEFSGISIPGNSLIRRFIVQLYRTVAKRSGATRGAAKSAIKLTRDVSVPNSAGDGDVVLPLIVEVSFSVPIGTNPWAVQDARSIVSGILMEQGFMRDIVDDQMI